MNKVFSILIIAIIGLGFVACNEDFNTMPEPEIKYTSTYPMNGEYWVTYQYKADGSDFVSGIAKMTLSNTAANTADSILIYDHDLGFKIKSAVNMDNLTFESQSANDYESDEVITVTNGKLFEDAGKTPENHVTDSIYMELEFSSAAGDIIICSGLKETGFNDDNH